MRVIRIALGLAGLASALICCYAASSGAAEPRFPNHVVKIIVGPSPDVFSRIIAERLQEVWGEPVIVEPRPGAAGKLAASAVETATADGHTLLFATPTYTLNAAMKIASYDLLKDFAPVAITGLISYALIVNPNVPAHSVAELVAYAKANPGKLNCASAGIGTVPQIACEYLNKIAGIQIVHVPFRDVNSGVMATVANTTQMFFGVATNAKAQIEAGTVRGLAVSGPERSLLLPQLPTMIEAGYPSFNMPGWGGLLTTVGTPPESVAALNQEVQRAIARPEVRERLIAAGMEPPPALDPNGVRDFIASDIARWTKFVDAIGLDKLDAGAKP